MKVLILTNGVENYKFVFNVTESVREDVLISAYGKYDWDFNFDYDIGISFMYQHKVPAKEVNSHTWFNFHPAPLPEYKGRNLCYHAIMNGETEFGATVHYMDENFDTGDIIDVQKFVILPYYTAQDVSKIAIEMSKVQFSLFFPEIISGKQFERLPNVGGTYYKKEPIEDYIGLNDYQDRKVRAITYGDFYPKVGIGGVVYKIVRDE